MGKLDLDTTRYMVDGKHRVLALFQDVTQLNTPFEYVVVYENFDTGSLFTARVNNEGRSVAQGIVLKPFSNHIELEDLYDL